MPEQDLPKPAATDNSLIKQSRTVIDRLLWGDTAKRQESMQKSIIQNPKTMVGIFLGGNAIDIATTAYGLTLPYMQETGKYAATVMSTEPEKAYIFKLATTFLFTSLFCLSQINRERHLSLAYASERAIRLDNAFVWATAAFNAFQIALYFASAR